MSIFCWNCLERCWFNFMVTLEAAVWADVCFWYFVHHIYSISMKVDLFIQVLSGVILELITDILHISFSKCITNLNHMNTSSKVKKNQLLISLELLLQNLLLLIWQKTAGTCNSNTHSTERHPQAVQQNRTLPQTLWSHPCAHTHIVWGQSWKKVVRQ